VNKTLLSIIIGIVIIFIILAIVFPDSTRGFFAKIDSKREDIERINTAENSIDLLKKNIEELKKKYNSVIASLSEIKVKKRAIENEIEALKYKIEDRKNMLNRLSKIYNEAERAGKKEVEIGGKKYTLDDIKDKLKTLFIEIKENLLKQLEIKEQVYQEYENTVKNLNDTLVEIKSKMDEETARLARITAKKTKLDVSKELEGIREQFLNIQGKFSKTGEEIEKALDEEIMKYETMKESKMIYSDTELDELSKDLEKIDKESELDEMVNKLLSGGDIDDILNSEVVNVDLDSTNTEDNGIEKLNEMLDTNNN
jgi:DNA repair exonuclease SbcCD ATPase subunit